MFTTNCHVEVLNVFLKKKATKPKHEAPLEDLEEKGRTRDGLWEFLQYFVLLHSKIPVREKLSYTGNQTQAHAMKVDYTLTIASQKRLSAP